MTDPRAAMAARNNADLYQAIFAAHGLRFVRHAFAFQALDPPPPYYSDLTITTPGHAPEVAGMIGTRKLAIKDSFCELDTQALGLKMLFQASWIWSKAPSYGPSDWQIIRDPSDLERWEAAWKNAGSATNQRMFPISLLDRDDIAFLARKEGTDIVAGCIANRSSDCVGLSNVFALPPLSDLYHQAKHAVASWAPGYPIVGYESGDDLMAAHAAGFADVGPLRVLIPASP